MKVTTGYALLLITIGWLFILVGQKFIDPTSFGSIQGASQPTSCVQNEANKDDAMQLERLKTELDERQANIETREDELNQRKADLDKRQANIETREEELNKREVELDQKENEYRVVLRVLYGLIAVNFVILIVIIWLAHPLIRPPFRPLPTIDH